jgi:serine/threonine protein kinase
MAKMIEEMTTAASTTMARAGSTRWLAPEIVSGGHPSKASDTYSFAMAILEMLSGKHPFYEHKSEVAVIRALITHVVPERPDGLDVQRWLTDDLWALMKRCWFKKPGSRPTMEDIVTFLNK